MGRAKVRGPFFEKGEDGAFFIGPFYFTPGPLILAWVIGTLVLVIMGTCPPVYVWSVVPLCIGLGSAAVGGICFGIYGAERGIRSWLRKSANERDRLNRRGIWSDDDDEEDDF